MSDSESRGELTPERGVGWFVMPLILAILAGIAAFGSSYYGTSLANEGNRAVQARQVEEERKKIEREKRAEVYLKFLDASTVYAERVSSITEICDTPPQRTDPDPYRVTGLICILARPDFHEARKPLHEARNSVYVYGSSEANRVADVLMKTLPASDIPFPKKYEPGVYGNDERYQAYRDFQAVVCREVPSNPRNDC